ncbi:hypothetical protein [Lentibacillus sp. CBA3610]|uniref:hypothetical protein n=1 Tax=Lentibacillus sp. CBA3610 TaxID=2518176 RepID=UPI0015955E04|nr:hypothetical protein [Lentibacillus sp. CBA3610]QKY69361.1 hypothetical protein Len3610_06900 [Lentibacillus sp. CBA3610]
MKSFYVRIVIATFTVMIISSLLAFFISKGYYQIFLKPANDARITDMAQDIKQYVENEEGAVDESYFSHLADLGYQLILYHENGSESQFGSYFRHNDLTHRRDRESLGRRTISWSYRATRRFFNNVSENTIGVPVETTEGTTAMFIRPDHEHQLEEFVFF